MLTFLIGHRGSGKTELLKRIQKYYSENAEPVVAIDLDKYIEDKEIQPIQKLFENLGEAKFRELENKCFQELLEKYHYADENIYLALGAGFMGDIPNDLPCIWVRRPTDTMGRIFLNRPRLDTAVSPLTEYKDRFAEREARYLRLATDTLMIPEGKLQPNYRERAFLFGKLEAVEGVLTLLPENFRTDEQALAYLDSRQLWGVEYFELRDDVLTPEQIALAFDFLPKKKILLSFRKSRESELSKYIETPEVMWDWPSEFGDCPYGPPKILSFHRRDGGDSVQACIDKLSARWNNESLLKLSIPVQSFQDLMVGHKWAHSNLKHFSFLPSSRDGRWNWYRMLSRGYYKLNFIREGRGSSHDQPFLLDWLRVGPQSMAFAAVLGDPIIQSRSPVAHEDFFNERGMPMFQIRVDENDWKNGALDILHKIGLTHAAVTSPLKKKAFEICHDKDSLVQKLESVNVMIWERNKKYWAGANTDVWGLKELLKEISVDDPTVVWGGGGTLAMLRSFVPSAAFYSARTGELRSWSQPLKADGPAQVIWAVGRSRQETCKWPLSEWKPKLIIDLNYGDDSPGKEYALKAGCSYISGQKMFLAQAEKQKEFWRKHDG